MSTSNRNGDRLDLPTLLEIGYKFQKDTDWIPPTKRVKVPKGGAAEESKALAEAESS
jgi:hypothetical protein